MLEALDGIREMKAIDIYTSPFCGFCFSAKRLLSEKGVTFREIDVTQDPAIRQQMMKRANGKYTVPQIFVGEHHVGGCNELYVLERAGKLDPLLAA